MLGMDEEWKREAMDFFTQKGSKTVHVVGFGNPIRGDDSVGLYIVESLRKRVGSRPGPYVRVHPAERNIERALSRVRGTKRRLLLLDAVEAQRAPGSVLFARVDDVKYGYFATHNLPLRLIPSVPEAAADVCLVGVQPERMDVSEELSPSVENAAEEVVRALEEMVRDR